MYKITLYIGLFLFIAFLAGSCIDDIDLNVDKEQRNVVVDGFIADSLAEYIIDVSYSSIIGVGTDNVQEPVTGADVKVRLTTDLSGLETRPILRWRVIGEYEFHEAFPEAQSLRWCYIKDNVDLNQISIFNTNELQGDILYDQPILDEVVDFKFAFNYCFHIFQYRINEEEFIYWNNIEKLINIDGGLFDNPPGNITGNIYNVNDPNDLIGGYFSIASVVYQRFFVNPEVLGHAVEPKCSPAPWRPQFAECRDCPNIFQSTLDKPFYWPN